MNSIPKIVLALLALLALATPAAAASSPCPRNTHDCRVVRNNFQARNDRDWWNMHRPSTPAERAETARLNREYLAVQDAAPAPQRPAYNARRAPTQYERELRDYRAALRRYEQDRRRYEGARNTRARVYGPPRRPMAPRPRRAMTGAELDNDPFAPTGGTADPDFSAPTPGLDGSTVGLSQFNDHASGRVPRDRR